MLQLTGTLQNFDAHDRAGHLCVLGKAFQASGEASLSRIVETGLPFAGLGHQLKTLFKEASSVLGEATVWHGGIPARELIVNGVPVRFRIELRSHLRELSVLHASSFSVAPLHDLVIGGGCAVNYTNP